MRLTEGMSARLIRSSACATGLAFENLHIATINRNKESQVRKIKDDDNVDIMK